MAVEIEVRSNSRQAQADLRNLERSVDNISKTTERVTKQFDNLVKVSVAAFAAFGSVRSITKVTDSYRRLEARIALTTDSIKEQQEAFIALNKIAIETRSNQESLADLYSRIGRATKRLGYDQKTIIAVTENVAKAITISGSSAESANAAIVQLGQGLAAGALRGQELNSVMEQTPAVAQAIARGLGITIGELRSFANAGQLSAEVVIEALKDQSKAIDEEFRKIPPTIAQSLQVFRTGLGRVVNELDKVTGLSASISSNLIETGKALNSFGDGLANRINQQIAESADSLAKFEKLFSSFGRLFEATGFLIRSAFQRLIPLDVILSFQRIISSVQTFIGVLVRTLLPLERTTLFVNRLATEIDLLARRIRLGPIERAIRGIAISLNATLLSISTNIALFLANVTAGAQRVLLALATVTERVSSNVRAIGTDFRRLGEEIGISFLKLPSLVLKIGESIKGLSEAFSGFANSVLSLGLSLSESLVSVADRITRSAVNIVTGFYKFLFGQGVRDARTFFSRLSAGISDFANRLDTTPVVKFVKEIIGAFKEAYIAVVGNSFWPDLVDGVNDYAQRLITGAGRIVSRFTDGVSEAFEKLNSSQQILIFITISRVIRQLAPALSLSLRRFNLLVLILGAMNVELDEVKDRVYQVGKAIGDVAKGNKTFAQLFNTIKEGLSSKLQTIRFKISSNVDFSGLIAKGKDAIQSLGSTVFNLFGNISTLALIKLKAGIPGLFLGLVGIAGSQISSILNSLGTSFSQISRQLGAQIGEAVGKAVLGVVKLIPAIVVGLREAGIVFIQTILEGIPLIGQGLADIAGAFFRFVDPLSATLVGGGLLYTFVFGKLGPASIIKNLQTVFTEIPKLKALFSFSTLSGVFDTLLLHGMYAMDGIKASATAAMGFLQNIFAVGGRTAGMSFGVNANSEVKKAAMLGVGDLVGYYLAGEVVGNLDSIFEMFGVTLGETSTALLDLGSTMLRFGPIVAQVVDAIMEFAGAGGLAELKSEVSEFIGVIGGFDATSGTLAQRIQTIFTTTIASMQTFAIATLSSLQAFATGVFGFISTAFASGGLIGVFVALKSVAVSTAVVAAASVKVAFASIVAGFTNALLLIPKLTLAAFTGLFAKLGAMLTAFLGPYAAGVTAVFAGLASAVATFSLAVTSALLKARVALVAFVSNPAFLALTAVGVVAGGVFGTYLFGEGNSFESRLKNVGLRIASQIGAINLVVDEFERKGVLERIIGDFDPTQLEVAKNKFEELESFLDRAERGQINFALVSDKDASEIFAGSLKMQRLLADLNRISESDANNALRSFDLENQILRENEKQVNLLDRIYSEGQRRGAQLLSGDRAQIGDASDETGAGRDQPRAGFFGFFTRFNDSFASFVNETADELVKNVTNGSVKTDFAGNRQRTSDRLSNQIGDLSQTARADIEGLGNELQAVVEDSGRVIPALILQNMRAAEDQLIVIQKQIEDNVFQANSEAVRLATKAAEDAIVKAAQGALSNAQLFAGVKSISDILDAEGIDMSIEDLTLISPSQRAEVSALVTDYKQAKDEFEASNENNILANVQALVKARNDLLNSVGSSRDIASRSFGVAGLTVSDREFLQLDNTEIKTATRLATEIRNRQLEITSLNGTNLEREKQLTAEIRARRIQLREINAEAISLNTILGKTSISSTQLNRLEGGRLKHYLDQQIELAKVERQIADLGPVTEANVAEFIRLNGEANKFRDALRGVNLETRDILDKFEALSSVGISIQIDQYDQLSDSQQQVLSNLEQQAAEQREILNSDTATAEQRVLAKRELRKILDQTERYNKAIQKGVGFAQELKSTFTETVEGIFNATNDIGDIFDNVLKQIASSAVSNTAESITDLIFGKSDGKLEGIFGSLFMTAETEGANWLTSFASSITDTLRPVFDGLFGEGALSGVGDFFGDIFGDLFGGTDEAPKGTPADPISVTMAESLINAGSKINDLFNSDPTEMSSEGIDDLIDDIAGGAEGEGGIFAGLKGAFDNFLPGITQVFDGFAGNLGGLFGGLINNLGGIFSSIGGSLGGLLSGGGGILSSIFTGVTSFFSGGFSSLFSGIGSLFTGGGAGGGLLSGLLGGGGLLSGLLGGGSTGLLGLVDNRGQGADGSKDNPYYVISVQEESMLANLLGGGASGGLLADSIMGVFGGGASDSMFGGLLGSLGAPGEGGCGCESSNSALSKSLDGLAPSMDGVFQDGVGGFQGIFSKLPSMLGGLLGGGGGGGNLFSTAMSFIGGFFNDGGIVPGGGPVPAIVHGGEMILNKRQQAHLFNKVDKNQQGGGNQQQIAINVTGDISRQTKKEIYGMLPQIATGVNQYNTEQRRG